MDVNLTERVASGASHVRRVLLSKLALYREAEMPEDAPVLDAAGMRVPVAVDVGKPVGDPPDGAEIRISARRHRSRYPVFTGTLRIVPVDALHSELTLAGHYDVPLGLLGALADRTVLASTAERSLQRLLAQMKAELSGDVLRSIMGTPTASEPA
jgi:hypothetical protein